MENDGKTCPAEENVEAICQFFNTIGKQLDENPKSRRVNDVYFSRLKELTTNSQLVPRLRFMIHDVLDLRANNWVPRREEVNFPYLAGLSFHLHLYISIISFVGYLISHCLTGLFDYIFGR